MMAIEVGLNAGLGLKSNNTNLKQAVLPARVHLKKGPPSPLKFLIKINPSRSAKIEHNPKSSLYRTHC